MAKTRKRSAPRRAPAQKRKTAGPSPSVRLEQTSPFRWGDRRDLVHLGIVLLVAFALRMVFFYFNHRNNPVFSEPIMDALYHDEWARSILAGTAGSDDVYFRGPLYPYLLALLYKLSGSSITFAVFAQHLIGTCTAGFVLLLAREYFSPRVSLVAGLMAALYWPFVYFEGDLLIVTTILFLNTAGLFLFARGLKVDGARGWLLVASSGIMFGLSAIARPSVLIFFPVLPLVVFWNRDRGRGASLRWVGRSAVVLGTIAVVILPVMVRNYVVGRAVVPVAASGGVNFYIGNNPSSDGTTAIVPGTRADWWGGYNDAIEIAEKAEGRPLKLPEVSDYYFKKGLDWIEQNPGDAAAHFAKKLRVFWVGPERANNKFIYFFWYLAGMKYVPLPGFWLVAPLALLGAVIQWRRRRLLSLLYLFVLTYMIGVVAFFVNARFRLPVVPVLIVFAAFAAVYLYETVRRRDIRAVSASVGLAAAMLVVNYDYLTFAEVRTYSTAFSHVTLANAYMKRDQWDTALDHYLKAWKINEQYPTPAFRRYLRRDVAYNLGLLYWNRGLCSRAIEYLRRVGPPPGGGTDIYMFNALDWLGDCYVKRSQFDQARMTYQEYLRLAPDDVRAIAGAARVEAATGNPAKAERMLEPVIEQSERMNVPSLLVLADIKRMLGKTEEAIEKYELAATYGGFQREALVAMAQCYQDIGDFPAAIETLKRALNYSTPGDPTIRNWIRRLQSQIQTEQP
ncbi:MAG: tetratricopeptide repeat protein [Candidatus Latescibacterota bacterium]|jgi:tetratricopeptide (TPR) repeat protein